MKTITLRTRSGRAIETVEVVRKVSRGLRDHQVGEGCYGKHTSAYAVDASGNYYTTTSASNWRRCTPGEARTIQEQEAGR